MATLWALLPALRGLRAELGGVAEAAEPDLIADYAHPLAVIVICELLGVDEEYREQWRESRETLAQALRPNPERFALPQRPRPAPRRPAPRRGRPQRMIDVSTSMPRCIRACRVAG